MAPPPPPEEEAAAIGDREEEEEEEPEEVEPWDASDSEPDHLPAALLEPRPPSPRPAPEQPPQEAADEEEEEDPEEVEPWLPSDSEPEPEPDPAPPLEEPRAPSPEQQPPPDPAPAPADQAPAPEKARGGEEARRARWPGWPGASVFRLVVPADKVGGLIGRRGDAVKRLCDETRARVRVLDAAHADADRIVLVSATEEVEAEISPAMNAAIKIFKHINEIEEITSHETYSSAAARRNCSVRLLVPSLQAVRLIGKQGITIKSIEESTGATIKIIDKDLQMYHFYCIYPVDELLCCEKMDERIVEIRGACLKVHNALKSVLGLLRRFLVDHGVLPLFERKNHPVTQTQDTCKENQVITDYPLPVNQDFFFPDDQPSHGSPQDNRLFYGQDPSFCEPYLSDIRHKHPTDPLGTQITQTMQIPLPYAEEIIGARGQNIEYIRSVSGAVVVLEESRDDPYKVLVTIKGSPSQVQTAHQLVQDVMSEQREPPPPPPPARSSYHYVDASPRLSNSPHTIQAGPRREYLPPPSMYREDQSSRTHCRHPPPSDRGFRGYWL